MTPSIGRWSLGSQAGEHSRLVLTRDSVAASDDIDAPHETIVTYQEGMTLHTALHEIAVRYLPHVAGPPVGWRAEAAGALLGWIVRSNALDGSTLTQLCELSGQVVLTAVPAIHFVYVAADEMVANGPH